MVPVRFNPVRSVVVMSLVASLTASPAVAAGEPPPGDSGVIQYTELVPTSEGAKAPGVGAKKKAKLGPKVKRSLRKASPATAKALEDVATSSDYRAPAITPQPQRPPIPAAPRTPREPRTMPAPEETPSLERTLSASAAAVAPVDDARMIGLLIVLVGIAVAAVVKAARDRST